MTATESKVRKHVHQVQLEMMKLVNVLYQRAEHHDASKLLPGREHDGWELMDQEPTYEYGTPEYYDKLEMYRWVIDMHYKNNSHHPEHYHNNISEMDLLDITEMLADWISYKGENLSYLDAIKIVNEQSKRFNLSYELQSILLNTLKRFLITSTGYEPDTSFLFKSKMNPIIQKTINEAEDALNIDFLKNVKSLKDVDLSAFED